MSYAISQSGKVYLWGASMSKSPIELVLEEAIVDIQKTYYLTDEGIVKKLGSNEEIGLARTTSDISSETVYENVKIKRNKRRRRPCFITCRRPVEFSVME